MNRTFTTAAGIAFSAALGLGVAQGQAKLGLTAVDSTSQKVGYPARAMFSASSSS